MKRLLLMIVAAAFIMSTVSESEAGQKRRPRSDVRASAKTKKRRKKPRPAPPQETQKDARVESGVIAQTSVHVATVAAASAELTEPTDDAKSLDAEEPAE
ncbi:MAG: hypothetical protein AAF658_15910, partial [Myxococcota bacterium]